MPKLRILIMVTAIFFVPYLSSKAETKASTQAQAVDAVADAIMIGCLPWTIADWYLSQDGDYEGFTAVDPAALPPFIDQIGEVLSAFTIFHGSGDLLVVQHDTRQRFCSVLAFGLNPQYVALVVDKVLLNEQIPDKHRFNIIEETVKGQMARKHLRQQAPSRVSAIVSLKNSDTGPKQDQLSAMITFFLAPNETD